MKRALWIIIVFLISGLAACENPDDENYLYLLSLGDPNQSPVADETSTLPVTVQIDDVEGDDGFVFDTSREISVFINVVDPVQPVTGSQVRIYELIDGVPQTEVSFQAMTDGNGNVQGEIVIDRRINLILIEVEYAGRTHTMQVDITYVQEVRRTLNILAIITPVVEIDTDGDGMPDEDDAYPNDATRATLVRFPTEGQYTIAFEDLFPRQGDADFNDYVIRARFEEDWNAAGDVTRVRAYLTHVARGAGYRHELRLQLPGAGVGTSHLLRRDAVGDIVDESEATIDLEEAFVIMPNSKTTLAGSNTAPGQTDGTEVGHSFAGEWIFANAVSREILGTAPYFMHLHVINTKHDIYFPGRFVDTDGKDPFVDENGFPWALRVNEKWRWPYEKGNIHRAYPFFQAWYESRGTLHNDWHTIPVEDLVFPNI